MFSKRKCSFFLGVAVLLSARPAGAQATGAKRPEAIAVQDDPNRDVLRLAKVPTDGPGLLRFLEKLGGKDEDLLRLDALIAQLGDAQFAKRTEAAQKTVALQHAAIAKLKAAEQSKDAEIKARAKDCLKAIYRNHRLGIPLTAIRVLAKDRPAGLAEALLHFLPYTAEEEVQEEVWFTLYDLVKADPRQLPLLEKSLQDPLAPRRALAGCVLGRLGSPAQQAAVQKLLTDPDAHVRLRFAQGLLAGKNLAGVATLIALLEHPAVEISWSAEELLHYLAGDDAPPEKVGAASDKERLASRKAWETWWGKRGAKFDFAEVETEYRRPGMVLVIRPGPSDFPTPPVELPQFNNPKGDVFLCSFDGKPFERPKGEIWVCGCDGKIRWRLPSLANSAQLLRGNRFLTTGPCVPGSVVSETDLRGNVLWNPKVKVLIPDKNPENEGQLVPYAIDDSWIRSARRLLNGNTFLGVGLAVEITRAGEREHQIAPLFQLPDKEKERQPFNCLRLLDNGRVLAVAGYEPLVIAEFDFETGQELSRCTVKQAFRKAPDPNRSFLYPPRVVEQVLANGNFLIRDYVEFPSTIAELDRRGKTLWKAPVNANFALRLRSGNTITDTGDLNKRQRLIELTPDGRIIWEIIFGDANTHPQNGFRLSACLGLVTLGFDRQTPPTFDIATSVSHRIAQLKSKDHLLHRYAVEELNEFGIKSVVAIPTLTQMLASQNLDDNFLAFDALRRLHPKSVPVLLKAANDQRTWVRAQALEELATLTDESAVFVPICISALKDKSPVIRLAALRSLARNLYIRLHQQDAIVQNEIDRLVGELCKGLEDPATVTFGHELPAGATASAFRLIKSWPHRQPENHATRLCSEACYALSSIGPAAKCAIPSLTKAVNGEDADLRLGAILTLPKLGSNATQVLVAAFQNTRTERADTRAHLQKVIMDGFAEIGPEAAAALPLVTLTLCDNKYDSQVRCAAARTIEAIGVFDNDVEAALVSAAKEDDVVLKKVATKTLAVLRSKRK